MFFGLGAFTKDTNFACLKACYGVGYVTGTTRRVGDVFLELQKVANLAARKFGLLLIDEDELIGAEATTLINEIAQRSSVGALAHAPFDKEKVAREAPELIVAIKQVLAGVPVPTFPPVPTPIPTVPAPPKVTKTVTRITEIMPAITIKPKTKIIAGVVIGALVLGSGIAVVAASRGRKRKPSTRGGPTRKARR